MWFNEGSITVYETVLEIHNTNYERSRGERGTLVLNEVKSNYLPLDGHWGYFTPVKREEKRGRNICMDGGYLIYMRNGIHCIFVKKLLLFLQYDGIFFIEFLSPTFHFF